MAFSSFLKCHHWTLPQNAKHPPPSLSSNLLKFKFLKYPQIHKELTSISASNSPCLSPLSLSPDFTPKQLLATLRRQKDETSALRLFYWASKQPHFKPTLSIYEEILQRLGNVGSFDSMRQILEDMKNFPVVLDMMEQEFGLKPGTHSYNFLLNVLVDGNKLKLVESVHTMVFSREIEPDVSTFNILIKALCKAHQIRPAILMIEDMPNYGLAPDETTFVTIMQGYTEEGDLEGAVRVKRANVDEAMEVLNQMLSRDCSPNSVTYNTLISTLCKENQVERATEFVHVLTRKGILPDIYTFNSLIQGLCLTRNRKAAMELFNEMKNKGCQPDEFTYNMLIDSLWSRGRLDEALGLLKEMESSGCARNVVIYNTLIDGFCKNKKIEEEAEEIFDQMELQGVSRNLVTYNSLINGLCKSRRVEEAAQLMDQMIMEGLKSDKFTYNSLLSYFCRAGDIKKASDIVQTMASNGCEPDVVTYGTLIQGLCKAGRLEIASRLLRTIQMKGMALAPQAYNPVIQALFNRKRSNEAMRLFREMEEKGYPTDAVSYKIAFRGLCSGGGPIGEAVEFVVEMTEKGFIPEMSSFFMLAEGLRALSMEDTLVNLVERIMKKAKFSDNNVSMIMGFLKIRKFQDALTTFGNILNGQKPKRDYR
ncbi:pentatricopeptide repeat (PPR) superfamily protein [Actinidia rufa]|uniref:Pentatricopeptide repeat (PPR) superfamily protein n=1 Tax=Actinidia rufa TaxID=165716 RepID=A0A7J0F3J5_9ERIC|nr:pentatricopeptide repeat (PPR) superfamily protein [Actinidia rufa]